MNKYIFKDGETFTMKSLAKMLKKYDSIEVHGIKISKKELDALDKFNELNTLSYSLTTKKKLNQLREKGKPLGRPKGARGKFSFRDKYLNIIKTLHDEDGLSYNKIAKKLEITATSVYRLIKDNS